MVRLGVNIDHVATLRNLRKGREPDPLQFALFAVASGANNITVHLRLDQRHIREEDVFQLKEALPCPLNLEIALAPGPLEVALRVCPHSVCFVPERPNEMTTEGGLQIASNADEIQEYILAVSEKGIQAALFLEPSLKDLEQAAKIGVQRIEWHTGHWCRHYSLKDTAGTSAGFKALAEVSSCAASWGICCHAGHGLNYATAEQIATLAAIEEVNIGHFIIGEALTHGLQPVIQTMRRALQKGRASLKKE